MEEINDQSELSSNQFRMLNAHGSAKDSFFPVSGIEYAFYAF